LGGQDLREKAEGPKLKSIDDFNKVQESGGSDAAPVLDRLQSVLLEVGVEKELFDQVVEGMRKELAGTENLGDADLLELVKEKLGKSFKSSLKAIAADQLRIK
jgi:phytoene/squalene synthetase